MQLISKNFKLANNNFKSIQKYVQWAGNPIVTYIINKNLNNLINNIYKRASISILPQSLFYHLMFKMFNLQTFEKKMVKN